MIRGLSLMIVALVVGLILEFLYSYTWRQAYIDGARGVTLFLESSKKHR